MQPLRDVTDIDEAHRMWREIFSGFYAINIKAMYCYTDWQMNVSGIPYTGDIEWDTAMANDYNTRLTTISEMADFYEDDITFYFQNPNDIIHIHETIRVYIKMMIELLNGEYIDEERVKRDEMIKNIITDLQLLANLANYLYDALSYVNPTKEISDFVSGLMSGLVRKTSISRHRLKSSEKKEISDEPETPKRYVVDITTYMSKQTCDATAYLRKRLSRRDKG